MTKTHRELKKEILRCHESIVRVTFTPKGKHTQAGVTIITGEVFSVYVPNTPSCPRARRNCVAFVKRTLKTAEAANDNERLI